MTIEIDQTIHGYKNGHQLLASSKEIGVEEKRILLVQSDLSGSNVYGGFESYITGYPIVESNTYCFSKTWYAAEMPRPGCVWTHTLLIKFQDLGKIPELESLTSLFKRPTQDKYREYGSAIQVELDLYSAMPQSGLNNIVVDFLYRNHDRGLVIPVEPSELETYESLILAAWSYQWPRLRRNFYFCSWALSPKTLGDRVFDLQVIPSRNKTQFERKSNELIVVDTNAKIGLFWKEIESFRKNEVRKFLWTFGADIQGERNNYIPLLQIFVLTHQRKVDLKKLGNLLRLSFPSMDEARLMKTNIYGHNSIISQQVSEVELVHFLVSESDIDYLNLEDLDVNKRFIDLVVSRKIENRRVLSIWSDAIPGRVSKDALNELQVDLSDLVQLLETDIGLLEVLDVNLNKICADPILWRKGSFQLQKSILGALANYKSRVDWKTCINAILDANSSIIFEVRKLIGANAIRFSLDWLVVQGNKWSLLDEWAKAIVIGDEYYFKEWVRSNKSRINLKIFRLVFSLYDPLKLHNLDISGAAWAKAYQELKPIETESKIVYISCALLSLALNNKVSGSQNLVAETFSDVYKFAANSKIDNTIWKWIPSEDYEDEDDLFFDVFSFFGFDSKKPKGYVPSWDYCEMLVRTLSNKFIKFSWSGQAFIDAIHDRETFIRALDYCLSFKKGKKFINKLARDSESRKIKLKPFQKSIVARL